MSPFSVPLWNKNCWIILLHWPQENQTSEIITKFTNVPNTPVTPLYWPRSCLTSLLTRHKGRRDDLWASFPAKNTYTVPAMVPMPGFTVVLLSGEFSLLACKSFQTIRFYNFRMNKQSLSCLKFNFPPQGTSRSVSLKKLIWPFPPLLLRNLPQNKTLMLQSSSVG